MTYLIDSDVMADWLKGRAEAVSLLSALAPQGLSISLITYGEIYEGIYYSRNSVISESGFVGFLQAVDVLPLDNAIMRQFAHLRGQLRAQGNIIGDFDLLIAATAIVHQLTLITRNKRHFQRVPGLTLH